MPISPSLPAHSLSWRGLLLAGLAYAALYGWYSWPLSTEWSTAFVGDMHRDPSVFIWNIWNFRQQILSGHSPMHTQALLYPEGSSLWMHTYTPVLGVLNVILAQEYRALNLGLLLSFVLSGVGAARLAGRWVRQPLLCVLVGFVFAFSPYKLARWPEHANLLLTATVPFYISAYLSAFSFAAGRWLPRLRCRRAAITALVLLLITLLSDYYVLAGLFYFSAGYAAWWALRLGELDWRRWQPWVGLTLLLVLSHFLSRGLGLLGFDDNAGLYWGGDLAGYVVPPLGNRWLGTPATVAFWHSPRLLNPGSVEHVLFVGYLLPLLALLLAGTSGWRRRTGLAATAPETRPFWALALLFLLLTMPELRWKGHDLMRLPTSLVHYIPFLNNIRCPTRHVLFLGLLLPLAISLGLDNWLRRSAAIVGWGVAATLLVGVFVEFQVNAYPLVRAADMPAAYRVAAAAPGAVLFPIPFGVQDGYHHLGQLDAADLFYQTQHHKAQPGGYLARVPAATFAAFRRDPVLRRLLLAQQQPDSLALLPVPTPGQVRAFWRRYPAAVFVVHPAFRAQVVYRELQTLLPPGRYQEEVVHGYVVLKTKP